MHNHCFHCYMLCNALLHAINVDLGFLQKSTRPTWCAKLVTGLLVTIACDVCQLCHSIQSFHNQIFQV